MRKQLNINQSVFTGQEDCSAQCSVMAHLYFRTITLADNLLIPLNAHFKMGTDERCTAKLYKFSKGYSIFKSLKLGLLMKCN